MNLALIQGLLKNVLSNYLQELKEEDIAGKMRVIYMDQSIIEIHLT